MLFISTVTDSCWPWWSQFAFSPACNTLHLMLAYMFLSLLAECRKACEQMDCIVNANLQREERLISGIMGTQAEPHGFQMKGLPFLSPCASQRCGKTNSTLLTFVTSGILLVLLHCASIFFTCCTFLWHHSNSHSGGRAFLCISKHCFGCSLLYCSRTPFFSFPFSLTHLWEKVIAFFHHVLAGICACLKGNFDVLLCLFSPSKAYLFCSQTLFFKKKMDKGRYVIRVHYGD